MSVRVEFRREWHPTNKGGDVRVTTPTRGVRLAAYLGVPPGSHIGFWRSRTDTLRGWNYRVGRRYRYTLTLMLHARREDATR